MSATPRSWARPLALTVLGLILIPPMLGARGGCKRECGCRKDCGDQMDTDTDVGWQKIRLDRVLQISRVIPDLQEPQTGFTADIIGAGLKERATVTIGPFSGTNVTVHTDARLSVDVPPLPEGSYDVTVTNLDGESVTLRRALTIRQQPKAVECRSVVVPFDFDEDALSTEARRILDPLMACFADVDGTIRLDGHTDERGTIDYNLALGQRRADAVHRYLSGSGVSVSRLRTRSYGEERPRDRGHDEDAWALNRRVEIKVED